MSKKKTDDLADWCEALTSAIRREPERVPPGWKTVFELAAAQKLSVTSIKDRIAKLLLAGKCERRKFLIPLASGGGARKTYHYRLVK
jgi:predicted transcriptional regulator